jgi:Grx4 family monothiol glutaredoxin
LETLASSIPDISFFRVEAEAQTDLSSKYNVTMVPSFVLLHNGSMVESIEGADDVAKLTQAVSALRNASGGQVSSSETGVSTATTEESAEEILNKRLKALISSSQVMLFMKGNSTAPRCGFSRQAVELLTNANIAFGTFDILSDEDVRQGLKKYSDWPTYPQLYVNGELIGGLDIMKEMAEDGDLAEQLDVTKTDEAAVAVKTLDDRLKELINRDKVMLFMKGLPSQPRCGFSRQIVEILNDQGISFDAFDILSDEEVRQGLKKFSDWPTYPQLYIDGDLVGGLDIVKELVETDELKEMVEG